MAIAWVKKEAELIESFTHLRLQGENNHIEILLKTGTSRIINKVTN